MRQHPFVWLQATMRVWWPFLASIASIVLIVTMGWVAWTVVDERKYFEDEAARDRRQDRALSELIESQQVDDAQAAAQVSEILRQTERLAATQFAQHDLNVAEKLNEMLRRIEALLGRPAGLPLDPVTALPFGPGPPPPPSTAPALSPAPPKPRPAPTTTTTTTTTPDQRGCVLRPLGPRC